MAGDDMIFNPEKLLEKLEQDQELACELLEAFSEDVRIRLIALEKAAEANDGRAAAEAAHSLKGMCGVLRVQPLVDLALAMECSGESCDMAKVRHVLKEFRPALDTVLREVGAYLTGNCAEFFLS